MEITTKLEQWRRIADTRAHVDVTMGVDVSTSPASLRASFPYPSLPPYRVLSSTDILKELVHVPSVAFTGGVSFALGACWMLIGKTGKSRNLQFALRMIVSVFFWMFLRSRYPQVENVSSLQNVSSCNRGKCNVTTRVLSISNSHAGTHADTPAHFSDGSPPTDFDECQYTGDCLVLDISTVLQSDSQGMRTITVDVLHQIQEQNPKVEFGSVWRLLLSTRKYSNAEEGLDQWVGQFAHFSPESVDALCKMCPKLLLVGLDTPSVDHPSASPISEAAHGRLYAFQVAILENLDFRLLAPYLQPFAAVRGSMLTVFNPVQSFTDSKGCSVLVFPTSAI